MYVGAQEQAFLEVEGMLSTRPGAYVIHWVPSADAAATRAADLKPDVILLDEDLDGAESVQVIRRLLLRIPGAVVLVMVSVESMAGASRAVMAGARGFVARPLNRDDLLTTIDLALARAPRPTVGSERPVHRGRVVVFCAPRGGTGRTTLAANTAVALRALGEEEIVLVDADYAAPAVDVALNLHSRYQIVDLLERMPNVDQDLLEQVLTEHSSGLKALLAPLPNESFEPPSCADIQEIVAQLKRNYTWVIVDLGLPLDELAFSFLDVADRIVVNVLPEMVGLRNTRCMIESMLARGYSEERIWLVASRSPTEGAIQKTDIEARLRLPLVYQIPDDNALVMFSLNRGVPAVTSHPRSALARAIRSFAQELVADAGRGDSAMAEPASAEYGWLGRLLGRAQVKTQENRQDVQRKAGRGAAGSSAAPAEVPGHKFSQMDLSESLLLEACPYLGLPREPSARFPYPCTANHCCSADVPVQVDPAYQADTCFGNNWTPCPRFMARLAIEDGQAADAEADGPGYEEIIINGPAEQPAAEGEASDLSGSFVLQSCPYLGLADDDATRVPYPDGANCCHARDQVRAVAPAHQAKACFAGDWASCPQFKAGLSDSFFLAPSPAESTAEPDPGGNGDGAYPDAAEIDGREEVPAWEAADGDGLPTAEPLEEAALAADDTQGDEAPAEENPHGEACPFLGLRDDPTARHTSANMNHYCHAGEWPQPTQPSHQVSYCLSPHWSLCENWEQATERPQPTRVAEEAPAQESGFLRRARERRSNVLGEMDNLSALYYREEPAPPAQEAAPVAIAEEEEVVDYGTPQDGTDDGGDYAPLTSVADVAPELTVPAAEARTYTDVCPHLALPDDPDRWVPYPHADNHCLALVPAEAIAAAYQIGTCCSASWRECPRCRFADNAPEDDEEPAVQEVGAADPFARPPARAPLLQETPEEPVAEHVAEEPPLHAATPCPYLGLADDEDTCRPTPHADNHCHTRATPYAVLTGHQERVCLSGDWQSCPRFHATLDGMLLSDMEEAERSAPKRGRLAKWVRTLLAVFIGAAVLTVLYLIFKPFELPPAWLGRFLA